MGTVLRMVSRGVAGLLLVLSCITLVLLAVHVTVNVIARYLFAGSLPATLEIGSYYYMVAVTFLPLAYCQLKGSHIAVDFIVIMLPPRLRLCLALFTDLLIFVFLCLFTQASWSAAVQHTRRHDYILTQDFDLLLWPSHWLLVVGLAAFAIVVLVQFIAKATELVTGETPLAAGELA